MAHETLSTLDELQALRAAACDWRLSRGDVGVYAVILQHANSDRESWPGPTRISNVANLAVSNVKSSLKRLEDWKYIEIIRPGLRKANRFLVLQSPVVPSKKKHRLIQETRRQLGMPTGLDAKPSRAATRDAGRLSTRDAGRLELGMRTGHELSFNSPKELSCATRFDSLETEEQRRIREKNETVGFHG